MLERCEIWCGGCAVMTLWQESHIMMWRMFSCDNVTRISYHDVEDVQLWHCDKYLISWCGGCAVMTLWQISHIKLRLCQQSRTRREIVVGSRPKTANSCSSTTGTKVWLWQSAPAYLALVNIDYQREPLSQTSAGQWLLASSRSGSTLSGEVYMQVKIAGAKNTSRGSCTM